MKKLYRGEKEKKKEKRRDTRSGRLSDRPIGWQVYKEGKARQGKARQDKAKHSKARQGRQAGRQAGK